MVTVTPLAIVGPRFPELSTLIKFFFVFFGGFIDRPYLRGSDFGGPARAECDAPKLPVYGLLTKKREEYAVGLVGKCAEAVEK